MTILYASYIICSWIGSTNTITSNSYKNSYL